MATQRQTNKKIRWLTDKIKLLVYVLFPAATAWAGNAKIQNNETKAKITPDSLRKKWTGIIAVYDNDSIGKMVDELYTSESQRLNILTGKGSSLLAATGFAISLISLTFAIGKELLNHLSLISPIAAFILLFFTTTSVIYFVVTAFCATKVVRVSQINQLTTTDFTTICCDYETDKNNIKKKWTLEKLVTVDLNHKILLVKSNWLDASQGSFLRGVFCFSIAFLALFFSLLV